MKKYIHLLLGLSLILVGCAHQNEGKENLETTSSNLEISDSTSITKDPYFIQFTRISCDGDIPFINFKEIDNLPSDYNVLFILNPDGIGYDPKLNFSIGIEGINNFAYYGCYEMIDNMIYQFNISTYHDASTDSKKSLENNEIKGYFKIEGNQVYFDDEISKLENIEENASCRILGEND